MKANDHFAFLLPPSQEWFSPKEVAAIIGKSDQYVRDAFDNQRILGHASNARSAQVRRKSYQIHRDGLLLFLLETANYEPADFLQRVAGLLRHRSRPELEKLQGELDRLIARQF